MKTIVLLGVVALLLLFLNWKTKEHMDDESGDSDFGPMIDMPKVESFFKSWGPDKVQLEKTEEFTIEKFDGDLGPPVDFWKTVKLNQTWEPDPTEFERIQRKIDKKADSRNPKARAIACAIDSTKGVGLGKRMQQDHWWQNPWWVDDWESHPVHNLAAGNWGAEDFLKNTPQCNTILPEMNQETAAMKCALDTNKLADISQLVSRELKAAEYLQKKQCQGYFTTDDMFI